MNATLDATSLNLSDFNWTAWSILTADYVDPTPYMTFTAALGLFAAIENLGILLVLFSNKRLMKFSSLLIGLTVAHALNGAMHAVTFWPKTYSFPFVYISGLDCLLKVYPNIYITMYQLLPLILALIGIERCLAVATPAWYRIHCTPRRLWVVTGSCFAFAIGLMVINCFNAWVNPGPPIYESCYIPDIFGANYMIFAVHSPAIISGLLATTCTMIGIQAGYRHIKKLPASSLNEIERFKRQVQLTKCILMVSCIDTVFVVLPNVPLLLYNAGVINIFSSVVLVYSSLAYTSASALNIVPYLLFNRELRNAFRKMIKCNCTAVDPIQTGLIVQVQMRRMKSDQERQQVQS